MRSLILLFVLLGTRPAAADELKPWPGPAETKPKDPPPDPAPPAAEEKPKEQPKPAPPPKKPPPPPSDDEEDYPCKYCDDMRRDGLAACKDDSSLPPPKDCRGNISNAAAECIKQCRGY